MNESHEPTFLVSAYTEPVAIAIQGKANYLNCNSFREFMDSMLAERKSHFVIDFAKCGGMDSTFLGILAGTVLELRKMDPPGVLVLRNLNKRNHELIHNLGLQNLLSIAEDMPEAEGGGEPESAYTKLSDEEVTDARKVLRAHENLIHADAANAAKFQDVIAFLKNQVRDDENAPGS